MTLEWFIGSHLSILAPLFWISVTSRGNVNNLYGMVSLVAGNLMIGLFTQFLHNKSKTWSSNPWGGYTRPLAAFLEITIFAACFFLRQSLFVAGYLVMKSMGGRYVGPEKKEGEAAAIFRIGLVLSIIVAFMSAYYWSQSNWITSNFYRNTTNLLRSN